jgi:AraC family transcriptional regulator, arabinose operon regulatory protein
MATPRRSDTRVKQVVQVLDQDPSCTLMELAHHCRISTSRLSHLFKDEVGMNVKNYRRDRRLQTAAALVQMTDMPIKEIAYMAGYRHPSSFVRAFKSHFGLSPASYRNGKLAQSA